MSQTLLALTVAALAAAQGTAAGPRADGPDGPVLTRERTLRGHTRLVRCLAFGPDGELASGGQDRLLCIWNADGDRVHRIDLRPGGG